MKPLERIARKINRMKEDPQDWAEFVTDVLLIVGLITLVYIAWSSCRGAA